MDLATWRTPAWWDDVLTWVGRHVEVTGTGELRARPWSAVLRVSTPGGPVWFKAAGRATAFEMGLYDVLPGVVPDQVLTPLALDLDRGWVLLPDGGSPLGEGLAPAQACDALVGTLPAYGSLQRSVAPSVDRLLAAGVWDMRPSVMTERFDQLLAATAAQLSDDASRQLHARAAALQPTFERWCATLQVSPLLGTLDHNDLHPHNVLPGPRWFDWGDAVVAHPFATMLVPLRFVERTLGPAAVAAASRSYVAGFAPDSVDDLVEELAVACQVAKVARGHVWERALVASREQGEPLDEAFLRAPLEWLGLLSESPFAAGGSAP